MRGLIIKKEPLDLIFSGKKTWEIRSRRTLIEGRIGLIQSKSGMVMGEAKIIACKGPLSRADLKRNARKLGRRPSEIDASWPTESYAWVLKNARRYRKPKSYKHPSGAIIWVRL
jgi:hypothetical protein